MVCPITITDKGFPAHIQLDGRTKTTGVILCDQAKILDMKARKAEYIEPLPKDLLEEVEEVGVGYIRDEGGSLGAS
jgi:mRNA interferase MazF